jgi:hypothetical protein
MAAGEADRRLVEMRRSASRWRWCLRVRLPPPGVSLFEIRAVGAMRARR